MSNSDPIRTPLAKLIDEHWIELLRTGGTPDYIADKQAVALYRRQIRKRARVEGITVRTHAAQLRSGRHLVVAWLPDPTEEQQAAEQQETRASLRPLTPPREA